MMIEYWEWLLTECKKISQHLCDRPEDADDVASEVFTCLVQDKALAKEIYEHKKYPVLYTLVKRQAYKFHGKKYYGYVNDYCRYKRIVQVCDKYNIPTIPENAYKISALITNDTGEYSIQRVLQVLEDTPPTLVNTNASF